MSGLLLLAALAAPPEVAPPPRAVDPEAARAKSLRWVLRFKVESGKNYVEQLKLLNAAILIPLPGSEKALLIPDLTKPETRREATEKDYKELDLKIRFSDTRREAVVGVAGALGLDFTPKTFFAFFPRKVEDELA